MTAALARALTAREVAEAVLAEGIQAIGGAVAGSVALLSPDGSTVEVLAARGYPKAMIEAFATFPVQSAVPLADAVRTASAVWLPSPEAREQRYPGLAGASDQQTGFAAAAAVPLVVEGRVLGAMGLSFEARQRFNAGTRAFIQSLAQQCALALRRASLYEREQAARRRAEDAQLRLGVLNDVATALAATMDDPGHLRQIPRLVIPMLADYCALHITNDDGRLSRFAQAYADGAAAQRVLEMWPAGDDSTYPAGHPAMRAFRSGMPMLYQGLGRDVLEALAGTAERLALLEPLRPTDGMWIPLKGRDGVLGVLALVMVGSGRRYASEDLRLAEQLATHVALAIDNARLYAEAQRGIRLREDFLSTAAHELKTPATTIRSYLQLVQRWLADPAHERERLALESAQAEADRLTRLIGNLLDAVRPGDQARVESRETVELGSLTTMVVDHFKATNPDHVFQVTAGGRATVLADRDQLEAVLVNLVSNAVKYSPNGGTIQATVATVATVRGDAVVSIRDSGVGIPLEKQHRIFQRFYRAHAGTQQDYGGMGIGLHLARELILRHGGRIWFTSRPGAGSEFSFSLPLASE